MYAVRILFLHDGHGRADLLEVGKTDMREAIIPLLASWLPIWNEYLVDVFAMGFVAWCGWFIHYLFRR